MKGQFNTHRSYSASGQVLHYEYDPGTGRCTFADVTRRVDGTCWIGAHLAHTGLVEREVLAAYDRGDYSTSRESLDFLNSLT